MTEKRCAELREVLDVPRRLWKIDDAYAFLDSFTDVEGCIGDGLATSAEAEDWGRFERYVFAASRHPDARYVVVLCSVLRRQTLNVNFDDIVIALGEIADPRSVPYLEEAMWWTPDWDEFRQLAKKCVWALGRIGTDEALEALRDAATVGSDIVREEAKDELSRRS